MSHLFFAVIFLWSASALEDFSQNEAGFEREEIRQEVLFFFETSARGNYDQNLGKALRDFREGNEEGLEAYLGYIGPIQLNSFLLDSAKQGYWKAVVYLIERGADPSARDSAGWTPLHWAYWMKNEAMADFLKENGADPNIRNLEGKTPSDLAEESLPDPAEETFSDLVEKSLSDSRSENSGNLRIIYLTPQKNP